MSGLITLGFSGLLLLMTFAGLDSVRTLQQIQTKSDQARAQFLSRTRTLEEIRSDLYLSGTYIRDYLLEPEEGKTEEHRLAFHRVRAQMDLSLPRFQKVMGRQQAIPFQALTSGLEDYWTALEPVFQWQPEDRHSQGFAFLRDEVFPRRTALLAIVEEIAGKARPADAIASFRSRLIFTIGLTIGLGLLLGAFTVNRVLRLESTRRELKRLSARLVESQEAERRAIARELHEEVGQSLSGALVELANLSTAMRARDAALMETRVVEIRKLVEDSVGELRNMALLLRPSMLDDLGLVPALEWQAREISKRTGVRVRVIADEIPENLPEEHNTCIFRVVQEALHNCVQHSAARIVKITVRQQGGCVFLHIQDDGKGFNAREERGMGLLGMQERVSGLGGTFQIASEPGRGAEVSVALPVSHA
jgi:signal transduction histidine kinase